MSKPIDLTLLSPASWLYDEHDGEQNADVVSDGKRVFDAIAADFDADTSKVNLQFAALARNDLDVKVRRGWHTAKCTEADQWLVPQLIEHLCGKSKEDGDALMAAMYQDGHDVGLLTKADRWYSEQVENADMSRVTGS